MFHNDRGKLTRSIGNAGAFEPRTAVPKGLLSWLAYTDHSRQYYLAYLVSRFACHQRQCYVAPATGAAEDGPHDRIGIRILRSREPMPACVAIHRMSTREGHHSHHQRDVEQRADHAQMMDRHISPNEGQTISDLGPSAYSRRKKRPPHDGIRRDGLVEQLNEPSSCPSE
ncbi:hypothetical protein EI94DRAFT_1751233 [Lactarius quietus]|nr:hypothetical protein EI94DRAFT_1751233 [Lactarius quietus]